MTHNTVVPLAPVPPQVSNEDFLRAVFQKDWERAHVCGFEPDPTKLDATGQRHLWAGAAALGELRHLEEDWNTFFSISVFHPDPLDGRSRRRKVAFDRAYCVVLDDVGLRGLTGTSAKVEADKIKLKPSWSLETSPGNWQVGYILKDGDSRGGKVSALLDALVASGLVSDGSDPGMKGVTRYVRLPVGRNTKAKYGVGGHVHVMGSWSPGRMYSLEEIAEAYGVLTEVSEAPDDLGAGGAGTVNPEEDWLADVLIEAGLAQSYDPQKLLWHVTCPFVDEHTGRADTGSAYLGDGRWTCHHGHCCDRDHGEFTEKVRADFPEAWKKITRQGMELDGDEAVAPSTSRTEQEELFGTEVVREFEEKKELGPFQKKMARGEVSAGDIEAYDPLAVSKGLLKGLVPARGYGVTYGASGIGKSFEELDRLLTLACGRDWRGYRHQAVGGDWVYVSSEGGGDELKKRVRGWADEHNGGVVPGNFHAFALSFSWGMEGSDDPGLFVRWCRSQGLDVRMVLVDTVNRNMAGDENSTRDMTAFVDALEVVWRGLGCFVQVIHHEGKDVDRGARGSGVLKDNSETTWRVFRDPGTLRGGVFVEKNRHGEDGMTFGFELVRHVFGRDADGDEVSTLVVKAASGPVGVQPLKRKYSLAVDRAYRAMRPANGWVDIGDLCRRASDIYEAEHGGARVPPSKMRKEIEEHLCPKQGWEIMGEGVIAPGDGDEKG